MVGSIASTIISGIIKNLYTPISIHISSGAVLKVFFEKKLKMMIIKNIFLESEINQ